MNMNTLKDIIETSEANSTPIIMMDVVVCRGNQVVFIIADEEKKYLAFELRNAKLKPEKGDMFILWTQNGKWFAKSMVDHVSECVQVEMTKELKSMIMAEEV